MRRTGSRLNTARGHASRLVSAVPAEGLRAVLISWVAARFVVAGAYAFATYFTHTGNATSGGVPFQHLGLLGWDAAFYRDLSHVGYGGMPEEARRFYPLLPLIVRILGFGTNPGPVLIVVVNLLALAYPIALLVLIRVEKWDIEIGTRTVWLLTMAPPALVLVMGYAEALAGLIAVAMFLALRTGHWKSAAVLGVLAGLSRPPGLLLVVPALVEALRLPRDRPVARAAAVLGPVVGAGLYFTYIGLRFGDPLQPLRIQQSTRLHGPLSNPITTVGRAAKALVHGQIELGLHLPWLVLLAVLVGLMVQRLPLSYTAWSAVTLLSAVTGTNLQSAERYAWSAFPFVLVAALLLRHREQLWRGVLTVSGGLLASYSLLAFLGLFVP